MDLSVVKNCKMVVGFSGGPDSTFLMYELIKLQKKQKFEILAVHINYQTRKESNGDEKFCKEFCESKKIRFFSTRVSLKNKSNFEENAREVRYDFFKRIANENNAKFIATGHNLDDSIETVFLNLTRGCGINGLTGIKSHDEFIRPILHLSKKEILNSLKKRKIKFRVDNSNKKEIYSRNKLRLKIMPVLEEINPKFKETFSSNIERFKKYEKWLNENVEKWIANNAKIEANKITILTNKFKQVDGFLKEQILIHIYSKINKSSKNLNEKNLISTLEFIEKGKNGFVKFGSIKVLKEYQKCIFEVEVKKGAALRAAPPSFSAKKIKLNDLQFNIKNLPKNKIVLSSKLNPKLIHIRFWQNGDKWTPLGFKGTKKLQDYFTDKKIPKAQRNEIPILIYKNEIIAVGQMICEKYKINEKSSSVLLITLAKKQFKR